MRKRYLGAACAAVSVGLLASATPSLADSATVSASWRYEPGGRGPIEGCYDPVITSTKDISNLVYVIGGETFKIEFEDGTTEYQIAGEVTEVWVKSGNNGPEGGLGEHVVPIVGQNCEGGGSGSA